MSKSLIDKIINIVKQPVEILGFNIIQVSFKEEGRMILEFLIEKPTFEPITITDCSLVSKHISTLLDVEDFITDRYSLEVSSPGIERPLVIFEDYIRFIGRLITIKLNKPIDNSSKYKGIIVNALDGNIYLDVNGKQIIINFNLIKKANLVFTDEMFKKLKL